MIKRGLAVLVVLVSLALTAAPASAEWFADLFAGLSFTRDHDVKLNDSGIGPGTYQDVSFDRSLSWGGRFGHYFDSLPYVGFAVDFFRFYPDIGGQSSLQLRGCFFPGGCGTGSGGIGHFEITTTAVSVDLMLRLPLLKTDDAPWGRLQPYLAVGPPLFITNVTPRNTRNFRNHDDDTDLSIGYKLAGGVAFQVYKNLALFGEYRFTHVSPELQLHDAGMGRTTLRTDLDTHSALIGLSARW
jgi:opacity protein-like surface antigen